MPSKPYVALKLVRSASLLLFGLSVCVAQTGSAPVVPADHYGPPVCSAGAKAPVSKMLPERAAVINAAGAADPTAILPAEALENIDLLRARLSDYDDCVGGNGCYWADMDAQYKRAESALDHQIATRKHGEKLAMVMDIDETSLTGYCEMKREDYGFLRKMNDDWIVSPEAAVAVPGAVRLFNRAKAAGVDVFFITGRPEDQLEATAKNLEAAGFHGWKGLYLRNTDEKKLSTSAYKSGRRATITAKGYRLLLSIGDQWSDLTGAPKAEISVKLPNPFYFLP